MLENFVDILAILATVFGTIMSLGYFPQIIKIIKRKSCADVSIMTYLIFAPGILVWFLYGVSLNNSAMTISNLIGLFGVTALIITYFVYKK
ncbi:MAG: SemiSWEET family transporter [Candidatus Aenigmatarchaeota archaeon]